MPEHGDAAPDFCLPDGQGRLHRLSDFRGKRAVLYFYPRDMTPECASEACGFRDHFAAYTEAGIEIIGVSVDPPESHERFAAEYNLPFLLLSDENGEVSEAYGVFEEKDRRGKKSRGVLRTTFVIGVDGRVEKVFRDARAETHAIDVLRALEDTAPDSLHGRWR
ncbi:MAG: peroxiredoxin [Nitrospinota bacterium]